MFPQKAFDLMNQSVSSNNNNKKNVFSALNMLCSLRDRFLLLSLWSQAHVIRLPPWFVFLLEEKWEFSFSSFTQWMSSRFCSRSSF